MVTLSSRTFTVMSTRPRTGRGVTSEGQMTARVSSKAAPESADPAELGDTADLAEDAVYQPLGVDDAGDLRHRLAADQLAFLDVEGVRVSLNDRELGVNGSHVGLAFAESIDDARVELATRLGHDLPRCVVPRARPPVRPVARHRVERVGDGEDSCP